MDELNEHPEYSNQQSYQQPDPTKISWKALCLVAKGLNPYQWNPTCIKVDLPKIWELVAKLEGQVNDDIDVSFYFQTEHHILMVLEKQLYNYRGWLIAIDRWSNRNIKGKFNVDDLITATRTVEVMKNHEPVELGFRYTCLQKICTLCGSLWHEFECSTVIAEYITLREGGEASGPTLQDEHIQTDHTEDHGAQQTQMESRLTSVDQQIVMDVIHLQQGTKRKTSEHT
ncbi:hypothetical protein N665_0568s0013 [Sinapis alba]|nr:hypothetical protein N665_0568s0013 [Sinapis alba]